MKPTRPTLAPPPRRGTAAAVTVGVTSRVAGTDAQGVAAPTFSTFAVAGDATPALPSSSSAVGEGVAASGAGDAVGAATLALMANASAMGKKFFCALCNVDCSSLVNYKVHTSSKRHQSKLVSQILNSGDAAASSSSASSSSSSTSLASRAGAGVTGADTAGAAAALTASGGGSAPIAKQPKAEQLMCLLCNLPCTGQASYDQHVKVGHRSLPPSTLSSFFCLVPLLDRVASITLVPFMFLLRHARVRRAGSTQSA